MEHKLETRAYYADTAPFEDSGLFYALLDRLPVSRKEKALRYRHVQDRILSASVILLLRTALKDQGLAANSELYFGTHGKPFIAGTDNVYISLSHSGSRVMCMLSPAPCGCDTEVIAMHDTVLGRFSPEEREMILSPEDTMDKNIIFTRLWTMRESYMKLDGRGLSLPLNSYSIGIDSCPYLIMNGQRDDSVTFHEYNLGDGNCYSCCLLGTAIPRPELRKAYLVTETCETFTAPVYGINDPY